MSEAPQNKIEEWIVQFVSANATPPACVRQRNAFISTDKSPTQAVLKYAAKWEGYLQAQTEMYFGELKDKVNPVHHENPVTGQIFRIICGQLGLPTDHVITREMHMIEDLGADSLDLVELVMAVEDEFNINLPDAKLDKATSSGQIYYVGNFVDVVTSYLHER